MDTTSGWIEKTHGSWGQPELAASQADRGTTVVKSETGGSAQSQSGGDGKLDTEGTSREGWSDERKLSYKLKQRISIPLAFHGFLFDECYAEYRVRLSPVSFLGLCSDQFHNLASMATTFRLATSQGNSVLEVSTKGAVAKAVIQELLSIKHQRPLLTLEVERRRHDPAENDENGNPFFFPSVWNKATLTVNLLLMKPVLENRKFEGSESDKQKAVFLRNLPTSVDGVFLHTLFPACIQCAMVKAPEATALSAVLLTRSAKGAFSLASSVSQFLIDGKVIQVGTAETFKEDVDQLLAGREFPVLDSFRVPSAPLGVERRGVKRRCPSDVKRNQGRLPLQGAGGVPSLLSIQTKGVGPQRQGLRPQRGGLRPQRQDGRFQPTPWLPPPPPFPDELCFMGSDTRKEVGPRHYSPAHDAQANALGVMTMSPNEMEYAGALSAFPSAPPFPEEMKQLCAPTNHSLSTQSPTVDTIREWNKHRPPGFSRWRTPGKIKRDRIKMTQFIQRKNREAQEKEAQENGAQEKGAQERTSEQGAFQEGVVAEKRDQATPDSKAGTEAAPPCNDSQPSDSFTHNTHSHPAAPTRGREGEQESLHAQNKPPGHTSQSPHSQPSRGLNGMMAGPPQNSRGRGRHFHSAGPDREAHFGQRSPACVDFHRDPAMHDYDRARALYEHDRDRELYAYHRAMEARERAAYEHDMAVRDGFLRRDRHVYEHYHR